MVKICRRCQIEKALSEFYARKDSQDGLRNTCKDCDKAKATEWQTANPERTKEAKRRHYEANIESFYEKAKRYISENRGWHREAMRANAKANPGRSLAYRRAREAAKLQATPSWMNRSKVLEFYFAADFLSMVTGEWYHVDHVVPLRGKASGVQIVC